MTSRVTRKNTVILVGCLAFMLMTFFANLPRSAIQKNLYQVTKYAIVPLGLSQNWAMFSAMPRSMTELRFRKVTNDGSVTYLSSPFGQKPRLWRSSVAVLHSSLSMDVKGSPSKAYLYYLCRQDPKLANVTVEMAVAAVPRMSSAKDQPDPHTVPLQFYPQATVQCER